MSEEIRFMEPAIKVDGLSVYVSPAYGQCVQLELNMGKHENTILDAGSSFKVNIYDLNLVDKLIENLNDCRNEIKTRRDLANDQTRLKKVVEELGENHPWTQRVKLCTDVFKTLSEKELHLKNCSDLQLKNKIEKEIDDLISIAKEVLNESSKIISEDSKRILDKESKPNWDKFRGNNHEKIELPPVYRGGSVDLGNHIGKPLSEALWIDLVHRLLISGLCVYTNDQTQWTIGCGDGHCVINLDEFNNVERIHFSPYRHVLYCAEEKREKENKITELVNCIKEFIKPLQTDEKLKINAVSLLKRYNLLDINES